MNRPGGHGVGSRSVEGSAPVRIQVLALLESPNQDEAMKEMAELSPRPVIRALLSALVSDKPWIKWRAVTAIGQVVAGLAGRDLEAARTLLRRQAWNLNEECGGCAFGAPESMAEIMANNDQLAEEFSHLLVSFLAPEGLYLDYEPLLKGALWGVGRVALDRPGLVAHAGPYVAAFLDSPDPEARGLAAFALGLIEAIEQRDALGKLAGDDSEFDLYLDGRLRRWTVGDAAKSALAAIDNKRRESA